MGEGGWQVGGAWTVGEGGSECLPMHQCINPSNGLDGGHTGRKLRFKPEAQCSQAWFILLPVPCCQYRHGISRACDATLPPYLLRNIWSIPEGGLSGPYLLTQVIFIAQYMVYTLLRLLPTFATLTLKTSCRQSATWTVRRGAYMGHPSS